MKSIKEFSIKELSAYGEYKLFQHGTVRDYLLNSWDDVELDSFDWGNR